MTQMWVIVLLTLVSVFLAVAQVAIVIMFVGVFKKTQRLEDVCRVLIDTHVRAYAMHCVLINTMNRYEKHLALWYNNATGLNWAFDQDLAAERAHLESMIAEANKEMEKSQK